MRKVLIISYYFSDKSAIAAVRINGLAKFLPKFGWEPFILTAKSDIKPESNERVFEAPGEDACIKWKKRLRINVEKGFKEGLNLKSSKNKQDNIDFIIKLYHEIFSYPDTFCEWRKPAVNLAKKLILRENFDAMISSSGPSTCHLIAKDLKERHELPWIADFRDLWTQNHYFQYSRIRNLLERKLEIKTLYHADALTTISQPLAEKLGQLHLGKKIFSIPNGFDPAQRNPGIPLAKMFTITYTGSLYRGKRDPEPVFKAVSNLVSTGLVDPNDISIEFYGPKEDWLEDDAKRYGLNGVTKICGRISREMSIEKQRRSHLLLLLTWDNPDERGVYTGKVFDYLAAERPIISIGMSGSVIEDLLKSTSAGSYASNEKDLKKAILDAYQEYKFRSAVSYHGLASEIDKYNHVEMARKFSTILDELVGAKIRT